MFLSGWTERMKNCILLTWIKNISMGLTQHLRDAWASWGCAVVLGLAASHAGATQPSSEAVPRPSCDTLADALSRVKCRGVLRVSGSISTESSGAAIGRILAKKPSGIRWRKPGSYWNVQECGIEHDDIQGLYRSHRL